MHRIKQTNETILFMAGSRGHKLKAALENTKWTIAYFELSDKSKLQRLQKLCRILSFLQKRSRPWLIIVDMFGFYALFLFLAARLFGIQFAARLRGDVWLETRELLTSDVSIFKKIRSWLLLRVANLLVKRADFLLPVSHFLLETIAQHIPTRSPREIVVPVFIAASYFQESSQEKIQRAKNTLRLNSEDRIILTVTNFNFRNKARGLWDYLPVFQHISNEYQHVRWVIVGSGYYYMSYKDQFEKAANNSSRIQMIGRSNHVRNWYLACDFLLHFSYADGFPNVILEAGASQKPCLANQFGGMKEQIVHNKTGLLVDSKDFTAVLEATRKLLNDDLYRTTLGVNAYQHIQERYLATAVGRSFQQAIEKYST